jgi:hypothetical protein
MRVPHRHKLTIPELTKVFSVSTPRLALFNHAVT